jgi:hypothetical protein
MDEVTRIIRRSLQNAGPTMSEQEELGGRLYLVGYEALTDHGLALPVFGRSQSANVFYTARSSSPGEANGQIAGFDRYDPDGLVSLTLEQMRATGVGEPWLDIFLWEGTAYVGTAPEIWDALALVRESIAEQAPLSLLALAEGTTRTQDPQLARTAFSWLTRRYGKRKASDWRVDTYLRGIVLKSIRRVLGASAYKADMRRALRDKLMIRQDDDMVTVAILPPLPFLPQENFEAFSSAAISLGLKRARIELTDADTRRFHELPFTKSKWAVGNRTSENAMRIAALQVAASKPSGKATTTELKNELERYVVLTPEDLIPSKTRPNEAIYQQIVGNLVSHRKSKNNIFAKGWAIYTGNGIEITASGRQYLRTLGLQG